SAVCAATAVNQSSPPERRLSRTVSKRAARGRDHLGGLALLSRAFNAKGCGAPPDALPHDRGNHGDRSAFWNWQGHLRCKCGPCAACAPGWLGCRGAWANLALGTRETDCDGG